MKFLPILCLAFLISCGGSSGLDIIDEVEDQFDSSSEDSSEEFDTTSNPIVSTQFFGQNGNLYKPRSDETGAGGGTLVVLLGASFTEEFDSCEIVLNTGEVVPLICINNQSWTQVPFSCFSNGNRQTWRASFNCDKVAEVKVTCREANQEVIFMAPNGRTGEICTRFG